MITGFFSDANFVPHGFLRDRNGTTTVLDVPGSANGTAADAINPAGRITGFYMDANFVRHGFLWIPHGNK